MRRLLVLTLRRLLVLLLTLGLGRALRARGVVDVTDFGAVGNGTHDDTSALRAALNASFARHAVLYFPARDYLITDSLDAVQDVPGSDVAGVNIVPARFHAHVLVGESPRRAGDRRPRLVLAAASAGFGNASTPKHMLRFHNPNCYNENENMNQILRGIDFVIRPGNPGAVAVHFHGAQGGTIQDVAIDAGGGDGGGVDAGAPALAGFLGAVGAGGSFVNVLVRGGEYGILARSGGDSESSSAVAGSAFSGQRTSAIHWQGQQSLVLVGTRIEQPVSGAAGAAVATTPGPGDDNHPGASPIVLVDCQVTCGGVSAANGSVVVDAGSSAFLHNVYTRSCAALLRQRPLLLPALAGGGAWSVAHDVSYSVDDGDNVMDVAYLDGERHVAWRAGDVEAPSTPPPPDLLTQHVWDETTFPAFDVMTSTRGGASGVDAVDDVPPEECASACGAAGDGVVDDTVALQRCLDACDAVVLPRGRYRVSATLQMRDGGALVGLSPTHSQIIAGDAMPPSAPLLRTSTSRNALAFVGLVTFWHIHNGSTLDWRAVDGRSIWRSNYETRVPECTWWDNYGRGLGDAPGTAYGTPPACKPPLPLLAPKSHVRGGGLFFNFVSDADVCLTGPGYRHLLVTAATREEVETQAEATAATTAGQGRLRFYGMNLEHAMGEANAEVRGATQGIDIYGLKIEGSNTILWARDAADINLWGLGGGADAFPIDNGTRYYPDGFTPYAPALFRIERTAPYRLASLLNPGRSGAGHGHPRIKPIHPLLNASTVRASGLRWSDAQVAAMVATVWAPWPGYYVSKELWLQHAECDGPTPTAACNVSRPFERPIVVSRGHYGHLPGQ